MSSKIWLVMCNATTIFGFAIVGIVSWQELSWISALQLVSTGAILYWWTFQLYRGWMRWAVYLTVVAWSFSVLSVFVTMGTASMLHPATVSGIMTVIRPYVFGLVPLILIWGARIVYPSLKY